jgi:hypothetical protein
MAHTTPQDTALHTYTRQVLSGTGLTAADVTAVGGASDEGTAAHALQHGWDLARRADKVLRP